MPGGGFSTSKRGAGRKFLPFHVAFSFLIRVFGCQMNLSDSRRLAGLLRRLGGEELPTDSRRADLFLFVSCAVREKGEERLAGQIRRLRAENPAAQIFVTGCSLFRGREELLKKLPGADGVFFLAEAEEALRESFAAARLFCGEEGKDFSLQQGPSPSPSREGRGSLPTVVSNSPNSKIQNLTIQHPRDLPSSKVLSFLSLPGAPDSPVRAFLPISSGCDNFCSYCVVPFARGREVSRPRAEILAEAEGFLKQGIPELFLLGQNVNSWRDAAGGFPSLLRDLAELAPERKWWLRFASSHPKDFSPELAEEFAENPRLAPWLHLALQSGSDAVLARMNRKYSLADFRARLAELKKRAPGVAFSTDAIVGFPGETEEDFQKTLVAFRELLPAFSFPAQFSSRPGTAAAELADSVPPAEKKRRWEELTALQKEISREELAKLKNAEIEILVERVGVEKDSGRRFAEGRTARMESARLFLPSSSEREVAPGEFLRGRVKKTRSWAVEGEALLGE